jgi:hypothetical protein
MPQANGSPVAWPHRGALKIPEPIFGQVVCDNLHRKITPIIEFHVAFHIDKNICGTPNVLSRQ